MNDWQTTFPTELPDGSVWEWETDVPKGWADEWPKSRAEFVSRADGLWPLSFEWDGGPWTKDDFEPGDRIRRMA